MIPVSNKVSILHLTPHLGGGVGSVLLNYVKEELHNDIFEHNIECLDAISIDTLRFVKSNQLKVNGLAYQNISILIKKIADADILLIHWWNHPLLYDFIIRNELPPTRLIMWSHVSGFNTPNTFNSRLLAYPDKFIFTTPLSFETKEERNCSDILKKNFRTIWSTSGVDHISAEHEKIKKGFKVGYIGTLDYAKLHPDFLKMCKKINIPSVKFIVCGDINADLVEEAASLGLSEKVEFKGNVSNVNDFLRTFDVFGYPLASYHYGTCDQVLAESMAAGVVPVVLSNPMEKNMVKDGETGIVVDSQGSYISAIEKLYKDDKLRNSLSDRASVYAKERFSLKELTHKWKVEILEILEIDKTEKCWSNESDRQEISSVDVFLESLGDYKDLFCNHLNAKSDEESLQAAEKIKSLGEYPFWRTRTKGTVHQYSCFFQDDKRLKEWSMLIDSYKPSLNLN